MRLHDFARNSQTQTATCVARSRLVDLIEALENPLCFFGWDVRTGVVDGEQGCSRCARWTLRAQPGGLERGSYHDAARGRRVLERILNQVVEHLAEAVRVADDRNRPVGVHVEVDATFLGSEQKP